VNYRFGGFSFGVRARPAALAAGLADDLGPWASDETPVHTFTVRRDSALGGFEVLLDRQVVHRTMSSAGVRDYVLWRISAEALDLVTEQIALHAGAASYGRRGVILPAPPDSGKSTLTAALVHRGFDYLSDEVALIDPATRRVLPFPRHLWLEPGGRAALASMDPNAAALWPSDRDPAKPVHVLPSDGSARAVAVRVIVFPMFLAGARTTVEPVSRAEALLELARNAFNLDVFGARAMHVLRDVVLGASAYSLTMGENLAEATDVVIDLTRTAARRED
jgi:hypothetical protein